MGCIRDEGEDHRFDCTVFNQASKRSYVDDYEDTQSRLGWAISGKWWVPNGWGLKCREVIWNCESSSAWALWAERSLSGSRRAVRMSFSPRSLVTSRSSRTNTNLRNRRRKTPRNPAAFIPVCWLPRESTTARNPFPKDAPGKPSLAKAWRITINMFKYCVQQM